jgi:hypothetical protein
LNDSQFDNAARLDNPDQYVLCSGIIREDIITFARSLRGRNLSNGETIQRLAKPFGVPEESPTLYSKVSFSLTFG